MHDFMQSAAPALTQPISFAQSMTMSLVGTMAKSQEKSVKQSSDHAKSTNNLFSGLFEVITGVLAQFKIMLIKLTEAQAKMMGAVTVIMYMVSAVQYTFMSMWNGIPGALIKFMGENK
jgi:hypothetical protein